MDEFSDDFPLRTAVDSKLPPDVVIFGRTSAMARVRSTIERVAATTVPVLIEGESGTGKDIIARLLHERSQCSAGPFVKIGCPVIPAGFLDSEPLEFAGRASNGIKDGRCQGTLFLDEISELDPGLQAKLVRILRDEPCLCRLNVENESICARVVCATNHKLDAEVESGQFRRDLFYRINVATVEMPPLRERREDIPELIAYFLDRYNTSFNGDAPSLPHDVVKAMQSYHWPGNMRELQNLMKRYVILGTPAAITSSLRKSRTALSSTVAAASGASNSLRTMTRAAIRELQARIIMDALEANDWNRKHAARALNISYRALLYKMREAGLPLQKRPAAAVNPLKNFGER